MFYLRTLLICLSLVALGAQAAVAAEPYPDKDPAFGIPPGSLLAFGRTSLFRGTDAYARAIYNGNRSTICQVTFKQDKAGPAEAIAYRKDAIKISGVSTRNEWLVIELAHDSIKSIECRKPIPCFRYCIGDAFEDVRHLSAGDLRAAFNWDFWIALPER